MIRDYLQLPLPVRILCVGSLVNRAGSFVLVFLTIYASEQLQYGVPFATACIGVLGFGSMAGSLAGGFLADRLGRRRVMLCSLFGAASLLLLIGVKVTERTKDTSGVADDAERNVDVATVQASESAETSEVVSFGST